MSSPVEDAEAVPFDAEVKACSVCNIVALPKLSDIHCLHCFRPFIDMGNKSGISDAASSSTKEGKDTSNVMPLHMGTIFGFNFVRYTVYKLRRYVAACDVASQINEAERLSRSGGSEGEALHERLEDALREQRKVTRNFVDQLLPYLSDIEGKRRQRSHWK